MHKQLFLCIGICLFSFYARACDVCGSAAGTNGVGLLSQFHRHFVGVRYSYQSFRAGHSLASGQGVVARNIFETATLWGRFTPHKRWQILAFIPLNRFQEKEDNLASRTQGLGDVQTNANYIILNTADSSCPAWSHFWQLGGGLKLPTGNYSQKVENQTLLPQLQTGTGSYDFSINTVYTLRYKKMGINTDIGYFYNTANPQGYQFGNRQTIAGRFFYQYKKEHLSILPQIGVQYEAMDFDKQNSIKVRETGGETLMGLTGVDVFFKRFVIGGNFQTPFYQYLGGGKVQAKERFSLHALFLF